MLKSILSMLPKRKPKTAVTLVDKLKVLPLTRDYESFVQPYTDAQNPHEPEGVRRPAALAELGHVHEVADSHGVYFLVSASTAAPRRWRSVRGEQGPRVLFDVREGIVISGPPGASAGDTGASNGSTTGGAGLPSAGPWQALCGRWPTVGAPSRAVHSVRVRL